MKFDDRFNKLYTSLINEAKQSLLKEENYPTEEELKNYFKEMNISEDNEYLYLKEGQYLEEVEGNGGWGTTHGPLAQIVKVIMPGFYLVSKVSIKNIGSKDEQKWVLNDEKSNYSWYEKEYPVIVSNYKDSNYLAWYMGKNNGKLNTYLNGYVLVNDVNEYLDTYVVDYKFDPDNR